MNAERRPAGPAAYLPYVAAVVFFAVISMAVAALAVWQEVRLNERRAETAVHNMALVLSEQIDALVARSDALVQSAAYYYRDMEAQGRIDPRRLNAFLDRQQAPFPEILNLRILDAAGIQRYGSGGEISLLDLSDREHFITARDDPAAGLIINGPIFSRISARWVLILARRLEHADGSFAGVVYASLETEKLGELLSQLELGSGGMAALRSADMALIARFPALADETQGTGNRSVSPQLRELIARSPQSGVYRAISPLDGIERLNAYHKAGKHPFYVLVGRATGSILAESRTSIALWAALCLALTLLVAAGAWRLFNAGQRRLAMAESLRQANEEQQVILDTATVGILLVRQRLITRCNRRMDELFGYQAGELLGQSTAVLYAQQSDYREAGRKITEGIAREPYREELELLRKDGSRFWARVMAQAIDRDDPGKGVVGTIEDISVERAAIAEMARARTLAEDAARSKADFLANMSHEIRTPLNAVMGMTHLLQKTPLTPQQSDYLRKIHGSSKHLLGVINDILDFSKIEAEKMVVERIEFELDRVLDGVAALIAEKAGSKGLELVIDVGEDVPNRLLGDPLHIAQVLTNYANNAVKFTERGEIDIEVRLAEQRDDELLLRFSVRDTGIGISEEGRGLLFRSFQQADSSTTRRYGGSGLGLVIAKRLVELMGGEVGLDSVPGQGSTFWFTALLGKGEETRPRLQPIPDLLGRRLMVVDDCEHVRNIIAAMLRCMGFRVTALASGAEALAELARAREASAPGDAYALAFIDWQMPEMDGIATARAIRSRLGPDLPLVMMTAYGREGLAEDAEALGVREILLKPMSPSLLLDTIMRALGAGSRQRREEFTATPSDSSVLVGARALLVEDNELNQQVAIELLQELGMVVDLAENGSVALAMVQQGSHDIVLMDMQMPVLDGLAATRAMRKLPGLQALPIVAMTANALPGDRERCLEAGMNDHLAKPIDPGVLASKLLQWIRRPPAAGAGTAVDRAPLPAPPAGALERLAGFGGLDVHAGLRQCLGREQLYLSLLAKFVDAEADAATRIGDAIGAADWALAERGAHTLKGAAAQIAAGTVRSLAEQLEHAIRNRLPVAILEELRAQVLAELLPLIAAIAAALAPADATPAAPALPRLRESCTRLAQLLRDDDFSAGKFLRDEQQSLRPALGDAFRRIAAAIENFDFSTALEQLRAAASVHGIEL
ncbi:response regulator [Rhodocyclus purpureus]|uniref:response regulator n=1 Tax=Rhodocyclus purpureus TaxID=1067 RepID=UPI0019148124|nr:response regulator [Rhodocyclus purpureus]